MPTMTTVPGWLPVVDPPSVTANNIPDEVDPGVEAGDGEKLDGPMDCIGDLSAEAVPAARREDVVPQATRKRLSTIAAGRFMQVKRKLNSSVTQPSGLASAEVPRHGRKHG